MKKITPRQIKIKLLRPEKKRKSGKLGIQVNFLNLLIKNIYKKPTADTTLNGEKQDASP